MNNFSGIVLVYRIYIQFLSYIIMRKILNQVNLIVKSNLLNRYYWAEFDGTRFFNTIFLFRFYRSDMHIAASFFINSHCKWKKKKLNELTLNSLNLLETLESIRERWGSNSFQQSVRTFQVKVRIAVTVPNILRLIQCSFGKANQL